MSFVPYSETVAASDGQARRWMLVLHGVFGSAANFRMFCRKLCPLCPGWGFVLVDLRGHARSCGAPGPHSVAAVVDDLLRLEAPGSIEGVMGHSLGGKIALAYAERRAEQLQQVWVLDSRPGRREDPSGLLPTRVLGMLQSLPPRFDERAAFVDEVVARGYGRNVALWLAMNLRLQSSGGYALQYDLESIEELLNDYFRRDLWSELQTHRLGRKLHLVVAENSDVVGSDDRRRMQALSRDREDLQLHMVAKAGHWLHVDAPDALRDVLVAGLNPSGRGAGQAPD